MGLPAHYRAAVKRWKSSFWSFAAVLFIVDRDCDIDQGVALIPLATAARPAQRGALADIIANRWLYILKARRIGISTIIAAWFFWMAIFTPRLKVAVVAHTHEAAEEIFAIYARFYEHLPPWFKGLFRAGTDNVRELEFWHGGRIKVFSARSETARGGGWHLIHASEIAQWPSLIKAIKSIFQTADANARVVLETTANGLNEAQELWTGTGAFKRAAEFKKRFYAWFSDPDYRMFPVDPEYIPPPKKKADRDWELSYGARHDLDVDQLAWLRWCLARKCFGSIESLNQEYPPTADVAFVHSGTPYFRRRFTMTDGDLADGIQVFAQPIPYRTYLMGVDVASGAPDGDRSAWCIIDPKAEPQKAVVATFRGHIEVHPFAELALEWALRYTPFTTVEMNYSPDVGQYFKAQGYPHLYVRRHYDAAGDEYSTRLGFQTNGSSRPTLLHRLQAHVNLDQLEVPCARLRQELNAFQYNKLGLPDHPPGGNDDLLVACALALEGEDQAGEGYEQDRIFAHRPSDPLEAAMWEVANPGLLYSEDLAFGDDNEWAQQATALTMPSGIPLT